MLTTNMIEKRRANLLFYALGIYICYYLLNKARKYFTIKAVIRRHGCLPPPKYSHQSLLGTDLFHEIQKDIKANRFLYESRRRFEKYGNTYQSHYYRTTTIDTIEPKNIQTWSATSFDHFGREPLRRAMAKEIWGRGIMTTDGPFWEHSRALIRPTFKKTQVAQFELFRPHVDCLLRLVPRDGSTLDLGPFFKNYIFDSATEFLLGKSVNCQESKLASEDGKAFLKAFEGCSGNVGRQRLIGKLAWSQDRRWAENIKIVHGFVDKHVAKALENRNERKSDLKHEKSPQRFVLLDEMAEMTDDAIDLRYQILQVFVPGHESTGSLLSAAMYALAQHPDAWQKLRSEIMATDTEEPTYEIIKSRTYLRYVLNETMRLWPLFAVDKRICYQDTVLPLGGGLDGKAPILVQKGTIVSTNLYALHRNKGYWGEDANSFRPERWVTARPTWEYIPFSGGPRICPAQQLVLTEAGYVIYRFVRTFKRLESRDPEPWTESLRLSVGNKNGVKVGLIPA